jgi:LacI family transcriptional regulator
MVATLRDVAKKVGKSITTVSRALHDYDDVSPTTKALVRQVATEIGYRPNTLAQRLQKQTSDTIGLIIPTFGPRFSDPFFSEFLAGIGNTANRLGYDLLVSTHPPGDQELAAYEHVVASRKVDGFICVRTRRDDSRIEFLSDIDFPFVAFGRVEGEIDFPYIDEDGFHGMKLVAQHLVQLGFERIACIAPTLDFMFAQKRLEGLRSGLAEHGIPLEDEYIRIGDLTQRSGYHNALELFELPNPPDAIAAGNDLMAFGAISAALERGLDVGVDIGITGFDDIPLAEHFHPALTTVHQPIYQIGEMASEMLIKRIKDQPLDQKQILLKPKLVVRHSCGANFKNKNL